MQLQLGPKLFSFDTFSSWVNNASSAWKSAGVRAEDTLCVDRAGRILRFGKHFKIARDEQMFPVDVYQIREDL